MALNFDKVSAEVLGTLEFHFPGQKVDGFNIWIFSLEKEANHITFPTDQMITEGNRRMGPGEFSDWFEMPLEIPDHGFFVERQYLDMRQTLFAYADHGCIFVCEANTPEMSLVGLMAFAYAYKQSQDAAA